MTFFSRFTCLMLAAALFVPIAWATLNQASQMVA